MTFLFFTWDGRELSWGAEKHTTTETSFKYPRQSVMINPFHATGLFLYSLKYQKPRLF